MTRIYQNDQKSIFFFKNRNFCQNSKFSSQLEIFVKTRNFCHGPKIVTNLKQRFFIRIFMKFNLPNEEKISSIGLLYYFKPFNNTHILPKLGYLEGILNKVRNFVRLSYYLRN